MGTRKGPWPNGIPLKRWRFHAPPHPEHSWLCTHPALPESCARKKFSALVVQPVERASVAFQVATVVRTDSHDFRIPVIESDCTAAWTAEGSDITPTDAGVDEVNVTPKKLAALSIISRELANDSSPAAQTVVGESIARDLARKIDSAFFGDTVSNGRPDSTRFLPTSSSTPTRSPQNSDAFAEASPKPKSSAPR